MGMQVVSVPTLEIIDGYNLIRRDRDGHAGGVCAYIREDLAYKVC